MASNSLRTLVLLLAVVAAACLGQVPGPLPGQTQSSAASAVPTLPGPDASASSGTSPAPSVGVIPPFGTPTPPGPPGTSATPSPTTAPSLPPGPIADALAAELDAALEAQRERYRIPGLTAEVVFPDGSRWSGAGGLADVARQLRATPDTTFVAGSITKTFVAAAIMQLQEEGALSIDDPLSDWLPDYPRADDITLAHLLSHTSGVYNYFEHPEYNRRVFNEPDHHWTPEEILAEFVLEPRFAPGQGYRYSNTGFVLLGMVIEEETGQLLGEVFRERFFEPLEMADTYVQGQAPPPPGSARGYLVRSSGPEGLDDGSDYRPTRSAATVAWGAGDIVSTAADLADWARSVYGGGDVLAAESIALMTDYNYSAYARGTYGLGTRTRVFDGVRMFGHTGSLRGFYSAMWHMPEPDLTIVVLTNRGRLDPNPIVNALAEICLPLADAYAGQ